MKRIMNVYKFVVGFGVLIGLSSCEWDSQDDYNTEKGEGDKYVEIDFSGTYHGNYPNGLAVAVPPGTTGSTTYGGTSGGGITSLTLQRSNNDVTVTDNLGNVYTGKIGDAMSEVAGSTSQVQPNAILATSQISFTGTDTSAGLFVDFTGTLTLLSAEAGEDEETIRVRRLLEGTWAEAGGVTAKVRAEAGNTTVNLGDYY